MSDPRRRSGGEQAYKNAFVFRNKQIPSAIANEWREYLYLLHFNIQEAEAFLEILKAGDALDKNFAKTDLLYRIHGMALGSFALAIRRATDKTGKRSIRNFVNKYCTDEPKKQRLAMLNAIHSHYENFNNNLVAHQSDWSILEIYNKHFPDTDIIEEDMSSLRQLYKDLTGELCLGYISIEPKTHDFDIELRKLAP